jgi:hypothetical protein
VTKWEPLLGEWTKKRLMELEMPLLITFPFAPSFSFRLEEVDAMTIEEVVEWSEQLLAVQEMIKRK